jgi:hypothetical protein
MAKKKVGGVKAKVIKLLKDGVGQTEVARKAGCSLTTVRYHAQRLTGVKRSPLADSNKEMKARDEAQRAVDIVNNLPKNVGIQKLDEEIRELENKLRYFKTARAILDVVEDA